MADLEAYRAFVTEYAPLGYARLYARHGDFFRAQHHLERALEGGFFFWQGYRLHVKDPAQQVDKLIERSSPNGSAAAAHAFSFGQSQKLQALEEALGLLRSFPPEEQAALVLLHVEEASPEKVMKWLGRSADDLRALRGALEGKLAEWRPRTGEDPASFFFRALRQYRLSPHFLSSLLNRLQVAHLPGSGAIGFLGWFFVLAVPVALFAGYSVRAWDRAREGYPFVVGELVRPIPLLAALALSALLFRRFLVHQAPPALAHLRWTGRWLALAGGLGFAAVVLRGAALLSPEFCGTPAYLSLFPILETFWIVGALALLLPVFSAAAGHYLRRLDRRGEEEK